MDWSTLHDATVNSIELSWNSGTTNIEVRLFHEGALRKGAVRCMGTRFLACPREFPWGESSSINEARVNERDGGGVQVEIEMQSGDALTVTADEVHFELL